MHHATGTVSSLLDDQQSRFLLELGITPEATLMDFNLAPSAMRREIALLGLVHQSGLGGGQAHFKE